MDIFMDNTSSTGRIYSGTAAWNVPKSAASQFPSEGSHLERYSRALGAVEINTSFYRHHKASTYAKWAGMTPEDFRFIVKVTREWTHEAGLDVTAAGMEPILGAIHELGAKLGGLLVQLPPTLRFDFSTAGVFFSLMRKFHRGEIFCEPRHLSWMRPEGLCLLRDHGIHLVKADPDPFQDDGGTPEPTPYYRWHGSPIIYESRYTSEEILGLRARLKEAAVRFPAVYCIFDNTKFFWASVNALELQTLVATSAEGASPLELAP